MKIHNLCILFLIFGISACKTDTKKEQGQIVKIRLEEDPDKLNPMLSKSASASQIENKVLLPLLEYDPQSMELEPVLAASYPEIKDSGNTKCFTYTIQQHAKWENGSDVTAQDYMFTLKAASNPYVDAATWRGQLTFIQSVITNPTNPKRFTVCTDRSYASSAEITGGINIYPSYFYDPLQVLNAISFSDIKHLDTTNLVLVEALKKFASTFNDPTFSREKMSGCGPYVFKSWATGNKIILERKQNWWGDSLANTHPQLRAFPLGIEYQIMPDQATAVTALKDGSIDVLSGISPKLFVELKNNPDYKNKLQFLTPPVMQYYSIEINNQHPILKDKKVRQAFCHLVDYDNLIENQMQGMAQRIIGPIHPSKSYYNKNLKPYPFDPIQAQKLLKEAGWVDANKDGILEKQINGKSTNLSLRLLVSGKELGKAIALSFQEQAKKAGVDIIVENKEMAMLLKDLKARTYDMATIAVRQFPAQYDPYQSWHSASNTPDGNNRSAFVNAKADSLINLIRTETREEQLHPLYQEFQNVLYEECPHIFLFAPLERIIIQANIETQASSLRPGYFENTFRRK